MGIARIQQDYLDFKKKKRKNLKRITNLFSSLRFSLSPQFSPGPWQAWWHQCITHPEALGQMQESITVANVLSSFEISEMQMQCTNSCSHFQFFLAKLVMKCGLLNTCNTIANFCVNANKCYCHWCTMWFHWPVVKQCSWTGTSSLEEVAMGRK